MSDTVDGVSTEPTSPPERKRRGRPIIPALIFLAIVAGMVFIVFIRSRPEQGVRRLIDLEIKLSKAGDFQGLYDSLSLRAKQACPKDAVEAGLISLPPDFWSLIQYRDLQVKVHGNRAIVTYVITYNGSPIEEATLQNPDIYIRASATVYGPTLSVAQQVARLTTLLRIKELTPKDYQKQKRQVERHGPVKQVLTRKGQWYDELDRHVQCQT